MRHWLPPSACADAPAGTASTAGLAVEDLVERLGDVDFAARMLDALAPLLPAASWSMYRTGQRCQPALFLSASRGVPDTTRDCWQAYLSGPCRSDGTWGAAQAAPRPRLCHVTAGEIAADHRTRVYDAHGVAERVSVALDDAQDGSVLALNFYRHAHQPPFHDRHLCAFESVAPLLLALARKHIALTRPAPRPDLGALTERLLRLEGRLTPREVDVCARLLQGMTHDGIASDLGLGLPTVKTYRNRAFARLGIHFRNELFARVLGDA
jgi:DNA-binding CsgD family transcriptional regulator